MGVEKGKPNTLLPVGSAVGLDKTYPRPNPLRPKQIQLMIPASDLVLTSCYEFVNCKCRLQEFFSTFVLHHLDHFVSSCNNLAH